MSLFVVDASVAVKLYVPEVHTDLAVKFFADGHQLIAPDLMPSEFTNILWKKVVQRGELTLPEARRIVTEFKSLPLDYYSALDLLDDALEIAAAHTRTVYDCTYVALAAAMGAKKITDDRRLANALAATPLSSSIMVLEDYRN